MALLDWHRDRNTEAAFLLSHGSRLVKEFSKWMPPNVTSTAPDAFHQGRYVPLWLDALKTNRPILSRSKRKPTRSRGHPRQNNVRSEIDISCLTPIPTSDPKGVARATSAEAQAVYFPWDVSAKVCRPPHTRFQRWVRVGTKKASHEDDSSLTPCASSGWHASVLPQAALAVKILWMLCRIWQIRLSEMPIFIPTCLSV